MLRKLLVAIVLLLQIGLLFAQNSPKPPPSPFTFDGSLNASNLPNVAPPLPQSSLPNNTVLQAGTAQSWGNSAGNTSNANNQGWGSPPAMTEEQQWQQMVNQNNQEWQEFTSMATGAENPQNPLLINNVSDKTYNLFKNKFKDISIKLKPYVFYIFYGLVIFNFLWLFFTHMLKGLNFKEFSVHFLINFFYVGLWHILIMNFPSIASYVPQFFKKIGIAVSSVPVSEADILDYGVNYIKAVWNSLRLGNPAIAIMYIILSVPTFFMILRMVLTYVVVLISGLVVGQINIIYLAFAGFSSLDSYAKKPFIYLVSIGLKLMFLQIFFGAILSIIAEYSVMPISQDLVLVMLIATSLCYVLVNETLSLVNEFIMGNASSTQFGSMKTAIKDTLLDTYKAIQSMNDAKNLMNKAQEMQQQQAMERMYDPEFAQRFAPKFNHDDNSSDSSKSSNHNNSNAFANNAEPINNKYSQNSVDNTQENAGKNDTQNLNQNSNAGNIPKNSFDNQSNTNSANNLDKKDNANQSVSNSNNSNEGNKNNAFNQNNHANQSIANNTGLNKLKDSVGTLGKAAKALLDSDFNLKKANQLLDEKIQKGEAKINKSLMSGAEASQERLWDKIYLGKAPSHSDEAKQYIKHGNELKDKPSYAQKYSEYVEQRRQQYQEQIQNSILPDDDIKQQQDNQTEKGKNEE